MSEFAKVDEAILATIRKHGSAKFCVVQTNNDVREAVLQLRQGDTYRTPDRRLQALRKRGLIAFNTKTGWSISAQLAKEQTP